MSEFIEFLSPSALSEMEKANAELVKMVANVKSVQTEMGKINTTSSGDSYVTQLTIQYKAQQSTIESLKKQLIDLEKQRKNENNQIREIVLSKRELQRQIDLEIKSNLEVIGLYGKVNAELNILKNSYRDLAIKKELGEQLSKKEQASLTTSFEKLTKYDQALKKVDASMGIHGRSVGNYASGFNPLSNSISQITRELPNFGQSMQIGILSLTNNIGAFQDAITGIKEQNKILQAEGQATKSVFSQVGAAFMSWNTLLYVGIGLLSAYGKEIGNWVSSLFEGDKALRELNERQKEFNNARLTGRKDAQSEILELRKYLAVLNDRKLSDEQRKIAQDAILKQYPYYIRSVQDAMLVDGKYSKGVNDLITALEKRKEVEKKSELNVISKQKLIDLNDELELQNKLEIQAKKSLDTAVKNGVSSQGLATLSNDYSKALKNREYTEKQIDLIQKQTIKNDSDIIKLKKETIGLEYQEDKIKTKNINTKKEKIHLDFEEVKSEFELRKAILERQQAQQKDNSEDTSKEFEDRIKARQEYYKISVQLLNLNTQEEQAILALKYRDDLAKNELAFKNQEISTEERLKNISDIQNRYNNEQKTADVKFSSNWKALTDADLKYYKDIQTKKLGYSQAVEDLILKSQKDTQKEIADDEKQILAIRQQAFLLYIKLAKEELNIDRERKILLAGTAEERKKINAEYADAIERLNNSSNKVSPFAKAKEDMDAYLKSLRSGFIEEGLDNIGLSSLKMFTTIEKNGQSVFENLIDKAKLTGDEFAVVFQSVGDVAQDVFNAIAETQQQNYDAQYARLEQERDVAILFAGESAAARNEIQEQYEQRRKQIARREAKAKQQQAIFNIAIDTAQALVAQLAATPLPFGTGFLAIIAALGAAQIAAVASQKIPQYYKGTDNAEGGLAWTQEKGREIITDSQGRVKSTGSDKGAELTMLAKGDKVFTAEKSAMMFDNSLNSMLLNNGIVMPKVEISMDTQILGSKLDKLSDTIASKESFSIVRDAKGERVYQRTQNERKELLNNILNVRTYGV